MPKHSRPRHRGHRAEPIAWGASSFASALTTFSELDLALEWCEDQVLGDALYREVLGVFARRIREGAATVPQPAGS